MASLRQHARMCALRSTLHLLRQRQFTTGHDLVVPGGACAPGTESDSGIFDLNDNKDFDSYKLASPHSPISFGTTFGRQLVVCGGVVTTSHTHLNLSIFAFTECSFSTRGTLRIFKPQPSPYTDTIRAVVPGHFRLWPRTGVG
ncbi:hypothetical protein CYMTET_13912 [Cymbomonas tetramitiformis]|uniref:Uncharacterized protein n=1 Tax=Cymbomonas tetramitiformis TaxID=36881 RepID=A0AAE0GHG6_9CHLO|nr:hypothetical protein CYMTET_13912 [Cymbomonas tetramitiformis]